MSLVSYANTTGAVKRTKAEQKISCLLIKLVLCYFLLTTPANVSYYWLKSPKFTAKPSILNLLLSSITNLLEVLNYSVNFYLYCCCNDQFRKAAKVQLRRFSSSLKWKKK